MGHHEELTKLFLAVTCPLWMPLYFIVELCRSLAPDSGWVTEVVGVLTYHGRTLMKAADTLADYFFKPVGRALAMIISDVARLFFRLVCSLARVSFNALGLVVQAVKGAIDIWVVVMKALWTAYKPVVLVIANAIAEVFTQLARAVVYLYIAVKQAVVLVATCAADVIVSLAHCAGNGVIGLCHYIDSAAVGLYNVVKPVAVGAAACTVDMAVVLAGLVAEYVFMPMGSVMATLARHLAVLLRKVANGVMENVLRPVGSAVATTAKRVAQVLEPARSGVARALDRAGSKLYKVIREAGGALVKLGSEAATPLMQVAVMGRVVLALLSAYVWIFKIGRVWILGYGGNEPLALEPILHIQNETAKTQTVEPPGRVTGLLVVVSLFFLCLAAWKLIRDKWGPGQQQALRAVAPAAEAEVDLIPAAPAEQQSPLAERAKEMREPQLHSPSRSGPGSPLSIHEEKAMDKSDEAIAGPKSALYLEAQRVGPVVQLGEDAAGEPALPPRPRRRSTWQKMKDSVRYTVGKGRPRNGDTPRRRASEGDGPERRRDDILIS